MADVFWNKLDDSVVATFAAAMGSASSYTTMKAQTINKRVYADAFEWSKWALPAISVSSYGNTYDIEKHGASPRTLYDKVFRYAARGIISGNVQRSSDLASDPLSEAIKEFYERMELVISTDVFTARTDNFLKRRAKITEGDVDVIRWTDDAIDSTKRFGVAIILFDVQVSQT